MVGRGPDAVRERAKEIVPMLASHGYQVTAYSTDTGEFTVATPWSSNPKSKQKVCEGVAKLNEHGPDNWTFDVSVADTSLCKDQRIWSRILDILESIADMKLDDP